MALLSSKLAEIDREVPEHLGVSPPLLDSIIFCHQEESTWPISEPRVLKERLDQIFCSVKYNKALKGLKDAKKSIGDIKLKEQQLEFLQKEKGKKEAIHSALQRASPARTWRLRPCWRTGGTWRSPCSRFRTRYRYMRGSS